MQEHEYESYYLRDFIYFAVKGWRRIIIFALIGAFLFTGVALYRNRASKPPKHYDLDDKEAALTDEEIKTVNSEVLASDVDIIRLTKRRDYLRSQIYSLSERLSNSIYLSIDENNQPLGVFDLAVSMINTTGETDEIIEQRHLLLCLDYLRSARGDNFYAYLERANDAMITGINLLELIEISMNEDNSINFKISGPDLDIVHQLSMAAQEYVTLEIKDQLSYTYPHNVSINNESYDAVSNPKIAADRERMETNVNEFYENLKLINSEYTFVLEEKIEMAEEQARIIKAEKLSTDEAEKIEEQTDESTSSAFSVIFYAIGGFLLGLIIAMLWNFYRGSSTGKLLHPDNFANKVGLLYINEIIVPATEDGRHNNKLGYSIDLWIKRCYLRTKISSAESMQSGVSYAATMIQGLNAAQLLDETFYFSSNVNAFAETEDSTNNIPYSVLTTPKKISKTKGKDEDITLTTTAVLASDDLAVRVAADAINKEAEQDGNCKFKLLPVGSVSDNISAIDILRSADSVLVMIRPRKTEQQEIIRSLEMAHQLQKPVLGLVSVEQID